MAQLPATRHLKAPQPNQAKCPHVSDSAVLLFAKSGSLSQVLSSQSGARPEPVQAQRGERRQPILSGAAVAGTMFRGHGSTWLMLRLTLAAETPGPPCALWLQNGFFYFRFLWKGSP